jgi:hypothetical protein
MLLLASTEAAATRSRRRRDWSRRSRADNSRRRRGTRQLLGLGAQSARSRNVLGAARALHKVRKQTFPAGRRSSCWGRGESAIFADGRGLRVLRRLFLVEIGKVVPVLVLVKFRARRTGVVLSPKGSDGLGAYAFSLRGGPRVSARPSVVRERKETNRRCSEESIFLVEMALFQVFEQTTDKPLKLLLLFLWKSRGRSSGLQHRAGSRDSSSECGMNLWRFGHFDRWIWRRYETDLDEDVPSHFGSRPGRD